MRAMTAGQNHDRDLARDVDRLDERTVLLISRFEDVRGEMIRGDHALHARIDKLDHKMNAFFGTLLAAVLAQIALQFLG